MQQKMDYSTFKIIEEIEYTAFNLVNEFLKSNYYNFINSVSLQINNRDLIKFISRQEEGRSKNNYNFSIQESIINYTREKSSENASNKELLIRLISSPIFKVALERFINVELTNWLKDKNINFIPYYSPLSSDYSVIINNDKLNNSYSGYTIYVDAKTIMSAVNLNDALVSNSLGKFQANWNEISYIPPILENKIQKQSYTNIKDYLNIKYSVLPNEIIVNNKKYLSITIFIIDLISLKPELINKTIYNIDSSSFEHFMFSVCIPNGFLKNEDYDKFFKSTKGGYTSDNIPRDVRIVCNSEDDLLKFKYLENQPHRFKYFIPDNLNKDTLHAVIRNNQNKLSTKKFHLLNNHSS